MTEDEPSAYHLNWMVQSVLTGDAVVTPVGIVDALCRLLRSPHDIDGETREAIAQALDRGRNPYRSAELNEAGFEMPRLAVEGLGLAGELSRAILVRRNWLNAAEALMDEVEETGRSAESLMEEIGSRFGLGAESMKKARKLLRQFHRVRDDPKSAIMIEVTKMGFDDIEDENAYYCARAMFIEREADAIIAKKHRVALADRIP